MGRKLGPTDREKDEQVVKWQKKGKTYSISTGNSDTVAFSFYSLFWEPSREMV